jgi:hypothetical protein
MDGNSVRFRVCDSANGNRRRVMHLEAGEFIGRFLLHSLPGGFKRIRHYGLLEPAHKAANLAAARVALEAPAPEPVVVESVEAFMMRVAGIEWLNCPCCREGRFRVLQGISPLGVKKMVFGYRVLTLRNHHEYFLYLRSFQLATVWFQQSGICSSMQHE